MSMHRLWGMRCYLGGPMDRAPDGGVTWRADLTPFLKSLGVIVLDPCNKPITIGTESVEKREYRVKLKQRGAYAQMGEEIDPIRNVDLRMVDISDFLIVNLDQDIYPCGTMEEMTIANLQLKPIFIRFKQGKVNCPDWLFAMLPHQYIHGDWQGIKEHLAMIHADEIISEPGKRWKFFEYDRLTVSVTPEESSANADVILKGRG